MTIRGVTQQYQTMHAHVRVDRILKGEVSSPVVTVTFLLPIRESIGYRGLDAAQYRLLFLGSSKAQPNTYDLTSPYYPSLPALSTAPTAASNPLDSVTTELQQVISSSEADWMSRRQAMYYSHLSASEGITRALQLAVADPDTRVSIYASAFLLLRNSIAGMERAEKALTSELQSLRFDDRSTLLAGISRGIHDPKAVPSLHRLLASTDPEVRSAAVHGLATIGLRSSQALLVPVLRDPVLPVRFAAAEALADITGEFQWKPQSIEQFAKDQQQYLSHWSDQ